MKNDRSLPWPAAGRGSFVPAIGAAVIAAILLLHSPAGAARFALLAGHGSGGPEEEQLRYVENDLTALRRVLTDVCGFEARDIVTLYNGTPEDIDEAITAISARLSNSDDGNMVLFYYSGHADDKGLKLGTARYDLSTLKTRFASLPARIQIGIFDACQSGSITRLKGGRLAEPFLFQSDEKVKGQVILSSCSPNEGSQESDVYRGSVFTFHLVNGLRGSADASGDRKVTLSEAYQYAYQHTVAATARSSGGSQHPGYQFSIQGEGEIVLADLTVRTAGVILDQGVEGDITVVDAQGGIVADLHKPANGAAMIALNPGRYLLTRRTAAGASTATAEVVAKATVRITENDFVPWEEVEKSRRKGMTPGSTHVDLTAAVGYELLGLSSISDEINRRFAGYAMFGISPQVWMPKGRVIGTGGVDVWIKDAIQLTVSVGYTTFGHDWSWASQKTDPLNNRSYEYFLSHSQKMDLWTVYTGPGLKIRSGWFRNLSLHLGVQAYVVTFSARSEFNDTQYDIRTLTDYRESGGIIVPVAGLAYRYPLTPSLDIGLLARYRYQKESEELGGRSTGDYSYHAATEPGLRYGVGGIDGRLFLSYRLGRN